MIFATNVHAKAVKWRDGHKNKREINSAYKHLSTDIIIGRKFFNLAAFKIPRTTAHHGKETLKDELNVCFDRNLVERNVKFVPNTFMLSLNLTR